jgi:ectoine hydroxylase-related dioxygenase (phytanoyl-CoA dioxygenase family)
MNIPRIEVGELESRGVELLERAGALVVTGVASPQQIGALRSEMAAVMASTPVNTGDDSGDFYPGRTRRGTSLVAHSETAREFVMHPTSKAVCDHFLLPNCEANGRYQLHVTAAIEIGPGARKQILHREDDPFAFFPLPRPNLIVATMWAVTNFTAANGGTLLVPGSHKWSADRRPEPGEVISAEMPAGSVLFWLGGTLHGGGANVSQDWRYGVILTYSLGWLRQEENQSLAVPPELAGRLAPGLRDMIGGTMNGSLGFHFYKEIGADPEGGGDNLVQLNS